MHTDTFKGSHCRKMVPISKLLIPVTLLLLPISIFSLPDCNFPAIFNFGDSNSDTGGLGAMVGGVPPPNGETFFHTPAGRYCDGRLVLDFIAEGLGFPYLSAFLDSMGTNFSHGANFATGGSTIRCQNTTLFESGYSPIYLDIQYAQFCNFLERSQIMRQRGAGVSKNMFPNEEDISSTLYTIDIGGNDLVAGYHLNMTSEQVKAYVPELTSRFMLDVKGLYKQGGRSFWIHNTGPLGCMPYILDVFVTTEMDEHGCAIEFNDVAQYFNKKLKEAVIQLRKELPLAALTYVDIYSVKYTLITQAEKLGFGDPFLVCCGIGGKHNYDDKRRCGNTEIVNGKKILIADSCKDPSSQISWDGIHYSEAANKWIYDQIVDGAFSDPPVPIKMACYRKGTEDNYAYKSN